MTLKSKLARAVGMLAVACAIGCEKEDDAPPTRSSPVRIVSTREPASVPAPTSASASSLVRLTKPGLQQPKQPRVELSPANATDIGVLSGTAKPAGPLTPEKFTRWKTHEELKVELEIQRRRIVHQYRALAMVEDREQQFLLDVERELRVSGRSIESCLKTFHRLKTKYADELRLARLKETELNAGLIAWERQNLKPKPFDPFEGVVAMKKPFNEIVAPQQAAQLAEHSIQRVLRTDRSGCSCSQSRKALLSQLGLDLARAY